MATVTLTDGTKYNLPDIGQAYKTQQGTVGFRQGNQILETSIENLGQKYFTPTAGKPSYDYVSAGERYNLGLRALQDAGIDYNALSNVSIDYGQLERLAGFSRGQLSDLSLLRGTPTSTGEQINVGVAPNNPHGVVVNSTTQGQLAASPSTEQALLNAGATPNQAATLGAFQQSTGGKATPYPTQLLQGLGVIPSVQDIMANPGAFGANTVPISASVPNVFDSSFINSALGTPKTSNDILSQIYQQYQGFQQQYLAAMQQSAAEQQAQAQLDALQQGTLQGQVNIEGQRIPTPLIGGQLDEFKKQIAFQQIPLEQKLKRLTTERQGKLDALKAQLGFSESALDIALQLQKMSKPDVVSTQVNKETGDVLVVSQNADGSFSTTNVGNVGASKEKNYTNTGTYRDSDNNEVFWGLTPDGKIETKVLGKSGVGNNSGESVDVVPLLRGTIAAALQSGATVDEAVRGAIGVAGAQGIDIKREDYSRLLEEANGQNTVSAARAGTLSGPQSPFISGGTSLSNASKNISTGGGLQTSTPESTATSFFSRLFGR